MLQAKKADWHIDSFEGKLSWNALDSLVFSFYQGTSFEMPPDSAYAQKKRSAAIKINKKTSIFPIKTTLASRWRDPKKTLQFSRGGSDTGALIGGFESVFFVTRDCFFVGRPDGFFPFFEQIEMVKQQDIGSKRVFRNTLRESIKHTRKSHPLCFFGSLKADLKGRLFHK